MGRPLSSLALIVAGVFFAVSAWRGHVSGELRAGRSGFRAYRPNRQDNPLGFCFYLALYSVAGVWWTLWGVLVLLGLLKPIPWR